MMFGFGRMKKVTDPLDDRVKARIFGPDYVSSGSEHSAHADESLPELSDLIFSFSGDGAGDCSPENNSDDDDNDLSVSDSVNRAVEDSIRLVCCNDSDLFRNGLAVHVSKSLEVHARVELSKEILRRRVMLNLRELGYNAAICKTRWERSGGLTAGNYEFIDIVRSDSTRYIIDLDFAAEFQIARPTKQYERLLISMPEIFVGKVDQLKQILRAASDAARRSLKNRGLHVPPWRKHRFMVNKWLGSYKRTTNPLPAAGNSPAAVAAAPPAAFRVECRSVGFDSAVSGRLLHTAATRTR